MVFANKERTSSNIRSNNYCLNNMQNNLSQYQQNVMHTVETPNGENIGDLMPLELAENALLLEGTAIGLAKNVFNT